MNIKFGVPIRRAIGYIPFNQAMNELDSVIQARGYLKGKHDDKIIELLMSHTASQIPRGIINEQLLELTSLEYIYDRTESLQITGACAENSLYLKSLKTSYFKRVFS